MKKCHTGGANRGERGRGSWAPPPCWHSPGGGEAEPTIQSRKAPLSTFLFLLITFFIKCCVVSGLMFWIFAVSETERGFLTEASCQVVTLKVHCKCRLFSDLQFGWKKYCLNYNFVLGQILRFVWSFLKVVKDWCTLHSTRSTVYRIRT